MNVSELQIRSRAFVKKLSSGPNRLTKLKTPIPTTFGEKIEKWDFEKNIQSVIEVLFSLRELDRLRFDATSKLFFEKLWVAVGTALPSNLFFIDKYEKLLESCVAYLYWKDLIKSFYKNFFLMARNCYLGICRLNFVPNEERTRIAGEARFKCLFLLCLQGSLWHVVESLEKVWKTIRAQRKMESAC